jgi:hypothetical protein
LTYYDICLIVAAFAAAATVMLLTLKKTYNIIKILRKVAVSIKFSLIIWFVFSFYRPFSSLQLQL